MRPLPCISGGIGNRLTANRCFAIGPTTLPKTGPSKARPRSIAILVSRMTGVVGISETSPLGPMVPIRTTYRPTAASSVSWSNAPTKRAAWCFSMANDVCSASCWAGRSVVTVVGTTCVITGGSAVYRSPSLVCQARGRGSSVSILGPMTLFRTACGSIVTVVAGHTTVPKNATIVLPVGRAVTFVRVAVFALSLYVRLISLAVKACTSFRDAFGFRGVALHS